MTTVDKLLTKIINHNFSDVENHIPVRDVKVLKNLAKNISEPIYITENQAKLLVKILNEHKEKFPDYLNEINLAIKEPLWERSFRVIESIRKLYISDEYHNKCIAIESTFSSEIRNYITQLAKVTSGLAAAGSGKKYYADLTEKNIVTIIEKLKPYKFEISEELKIYYETIKSWSKNDIEDQYRITTISYPNFEKQIINDLGIETAIDQNIINDRRIRYQYFVENLEKFPKSLSEMLANRETTKIWVDKSVFSITDLIRSFIELKRLPTLVVLDSRDEKKCLEDLKILRDSLEEADIFDKIGVYFRLDNSVTGKEFNQLISDQKYNCQLDSTTNIVVVQSGKIPKFLLKSDWKPMSVVSMNHTLRHSKTAVYANCCDLIATYTDAQPIIELRSPWE